jgi:hypothetical protein
LPCADTSKISLGTLADVYAILNPDDACFTPATCDPACESPQFCEQIDDSNAECASCTTGTATGGNTGTFEELACIL